MGPSPALLAPNLVHPALLSCLNNIIEDKDIAVWGGDADRYRDELNRATGVQSAELEADIIPDFLICVDTERGLDFLSSPVARDALDAGAIVVTWSESPGDVGFSTPYSAHYIQQTMTGVLVRDVHFATSKVALLHDAIPEPAPTVQISLWSNEPIPALQTGFFQACTTLDVPENLNIPAVDVLRTDERAVGLAKRLLEVEERTLLLQGEILRLSQMSGGHGGGPHQATWFDTPKTRHEWPDAEQEEPRLPRSLYDARPDDAVIRQAKLGVEFFSAHGLDGDAPNFASAVAALNQLPRRLSIDNESADVSIIIPVYGQLPYTLTCLHSLFLHESKYTAEIIVIDDCSPDGFTAEFMPLVQDVRYHRQPKNGGFIRSCNTGGELSNGQYVLMLNNDTRVVDGWLDNILDSFRLFPKAGLIGSKMLYPDGVLQEAGGILWRDGSAWNYGRNDDPNRPQYCYARQVDYISGCSIVTSTALWRQLGGFDPHYTPAYAEDADLCQRVAAQGLEVWFQPTSRVIHYEGKTSGTQTSGGVKAYQVINLRKLFMRWRGKFESHRRNAEAPYFEKERGVVKRILFVDAVTPTPDQDAGSVQTVLGLRCAQRGGYKTHFIPEDNWLFDPKYTPMMQREGIECFYAPFDVGFENYIRLYGGLFDVILVYRVSVMQKSLPLIRQYAPNAVALFHLADLHYLRLQRQAEVENSEDLASLAEAMKIKEIDTILQSDCTITHSTVEAEIIAAEAPGAPVTVWPLMMETAGTDVEFEARRDLCFLGGYRHPPNVDAVFYFVSEVLPLIHAARPELRFIVAGANPTPEIKELASDNILVTGMVEDLREIFDASRVFVCPLRVGAGAKGKVMSALAYGLPVVSSAIGVEGAGLVDGEHVLVADSARAMAETILKIYDDPILWRRLSAAGMSLVQDKFSLNMGVEQLEEAVNKGYRKRLGLLDK